MDLVHVLDHLLYTSSLVVAHQAGAYPGLRSMKQLGVFLLLPGLDASPSQSYLFYSHENEVD